MGPEYKELKGLVRGGGLHTVCEEAGCPNIYECWEDREATFLIGGEQCTRRCDFCQIDTGKPAELDRDEPRRVAESVRAMGLRYSTVTGVARDDLPDGGAWLYAETVRQIHALNPGTGVELLIPDFNSRDDQLAEVFGSRPEVLAHNLETVPRIFKRIRPAFRYERSLEVITKARAAGLVTKSNLILGMGETPDEVTAALRDLHDAGCEIVTISQYLRPSVRHHPVERWVKPEEFVEHAKAAEEMGFAGVMAGPLVRSSYRAGRLYAQTIAHRGEELPPQLAHLPAEGPAAQEASAPLARCAGRLPPRLLDAKAGGEPDKEAKKAAKRARREASRARYKQIWQAFQMQRREDKALLPLMIGALLVSIAVFFGIGLIFDLHWILLPLGIAVGVLVAVSIFGRRVQRNVYSKAEGQPGAAGWALDNLRGQWRVTPGVAGTTHLDAVHRVIGRPGIILVAEGAPHRVRGLLAQEKK